MQIEVDTSSHDAAQVAKSSSMTSSSVNCLTAPGCAAKLRVTYEPRCEKTGLRGFRPGPTQTGLCNH